MKARTGRWLLAAGCAAAGAASAASNGLWVVERLDAEAVATVWTYIEHRDCAGAAKALNEGVAKRYPQTLLLAGAMFEDGVCLKPAWDKAADFYQRAHEAGQPYAAARLAAGYMSAAAGPDRAAALWWALRSNLPLPKECTQVKALVDDADKFVAALRTWPVARVEGCSYVAGVVGTVMGDVEFSKRAAAHGLKGTMLARFTPAQDRIDVEAVELEFINVMGAMTGDDRRDRDSNFVKREFERDIRAAADRALKRYPRPMALDPSWLVTMRFGFGYVLR